MGIIASVLLQCSEVIHRFTVYEQTTEGAYILTLYENIAKLPKFSTLKRFGVTKEICLLYSDDLFKLRHLRCIIAKKEMCIINDSSINFCSDI